MSKILEFLEDKARWVKVTLAILPLFFTISSGLFWIDTRYMHKSIAESQFLELQLIVYTRALKFYERKIDNEGYTPTTEETREYNLLLDTVSDLNVRRNKELGLK